MNYRGDDDYEYVDDDDFYDGDEDDDDDDEELGGDWRNRLGSNRSSNLPGANRSSNVLGSSGATSGRTNSVFSDRSTPGSTSPDSRGKVSPYSSGGGSSNRTTSSFSSGSQSRDSLRDRVQRSGDTGSLRSKGDTGNLRSKGDTGRLQSKGDTGNLRSPVEKGSSSGGGNWRDQLSPSDSTRGKSDSKSSNRFNIGGNKSNAEKSNPQKDDKKDSSGIGSRLGGIRNRVSGGDDKKPASKDDKKGGVGSRLGGIRNRVSGGDDKKPASKDDKKGGVGSRLGGIRNRVSGGGDKKPTSKDDNKTTATTAAAAGIGSRLGGIRNRFGGGGDDSKKSADTGNKSGSDFRNRNNKDAKDGKQSAFGASRASKDSKDSKAAASDGGSRFGNLFNRGKSDDKAAKPQPKARTSKAPKVESDDWFDLDRKLDLVGVGLVFGAIILFASALSQEQAAISAIHNFIGQLFGWGSLAVPIAMFAVGMWLIVRHFGDDAPTVDPLRLGGIVIGFIALLTLFQYIDSFNYIENIPDAQTARIMQCGENPEASCTQDLKGLGECNISITNACLEGLVKYSYEQADGGGIVGGWLYLTLVNNITELGGFVLVAMILTFAIMMITHLSMAEIAIVFIGVGRSLRTSMAQNAARRRAQKLRTQQQRALAAQAASISVSTPAPAQLPGMSVAAALPEPTDDNAIPISERDILIRRGGQAFSSKELEQQPILLGTNAQNQPVPQKSGGLFGRLRGNKQTTQPQQGIAVPAAAATASAGLMGRLFNRGGDTNQEQPVQQPAAHTQPFPAQATNMPVGGNGIAQPQQPVPNPVAQPQPTQQPVQQPMQQPAVAYDAAAQPQQPVPNPVAQPQPTQPPAAAQQPTPAIAQPDALALRQDRLNAIRQGKTAPQPAVTEAQTPPVVASNGGGNGNGNTNYNVFGRPDDIPTHESEILPGQDFSTTKPITTDSVPDPQMNQIKPTPSVQKPVSSGPVNQTRQRHNWKLPDFRTLFASGSEQEFDRETLLNQARIVEETLASFGAPGRVVEVNTGPVITQFGVEPDYLTTRSGKKSRVKVSAIAQLDKDLQLALGAKTIRVEAPVPGKGYVGIEVPNPDASLVSLRDVMESEGFQKIKSPLAIALGMSVDGTPISADLTSMPHLLIAGTTGSGKSVCVNAIINSIVATNSPEQVKFIMVDPKRVELTGYNGVPHLIAPVVVELERIVGVLKWVTREMDERYKKFSNAGARNIIDYNKHRDTNLEPMPYIVVIIDELADLMMLAPEETERTITRIAALARATGIHLVIATQRPSVDVVTGLIKANFPARIAFAVAGGVDSRVILDQPGAERLLGKGDMLYLSGDSPAPLRLQGVFVSDMEIDNISRYWKMQSAGVEAVQPISIMPTPAAPGSQPVAAASTSAPAKAQPVARSQQVAFWDDSSSSEPNDPQKLAVEDKTGNPDPQEDELYQTAVDMVRRLDKASISLLQRRLRIGYTRAARLIDMMEERGVVGPSKEGSSKPRDVIPE